MYFLIIQGTMFAYFSFVAFQNFLNTGTNMHWCFANKSVCALTSQTQKQCEKTNKQTNIMWLFKFFSKPGINVYELNFGHIKACLFLHHKVTFYSEFHLDIFRNTFFNT